MIWCRGYGPVAGSWLVVRRRDPPICLHVSDMIHSCSTEGGQPMPENADMTPGLSRPDLVRVLESAARLQAVVPDAILVGGSAAALWASHRTAFAHAPGLADLD